MVRFGLPLVALAAALAVPAFSGTATAQATPPLPSMPRPPSFDEPSAGGALKSKPTRRQGRAPAAGSQSDAASSFDRPTKFVPAEFDRERRGASGGRAQPMMSGSGRPAVGMRF